MKWTVGTKIGLGFATAVILAIVGAVAYHSTVQLNATNYWVTHTYQVLGETSGLIQSLTDCETGQRGYLITSDEAYLEPYLNGRGTVEQHLQTLRTLTADNIQQQQRLAALETLITQRLARFKEGIDIHKTKGSEASRAWVQSGEGKQQMDAIRLAVAQIHQVETVLLKERTDEAQASAVNTKLAIIGGTAAAAVILGLAGFFITRNIAGPLKEITITAQQIARGDLNISLAMRRRRNDEVGVLAQTFVTMADSLRQMAGVAEKIAAGDLRVKVTPQSSKDILGNAFATMISNLQRLTTQLTQSVKVLNTSTSEISASSSQLAGGATETATAVAQTMTTVEEIRQTAELTSQKSRSVSDVAQKVVQTAAAGRKSTQNTADGIARIREQMDSIAGSMVRLSEQTQAIGQIIASVDDLSAQSNLLAVNAAIEAAKAGEQGKGFAIVAQEVRSLAEQSKHATTQVRAILHDIQKATSAAVMATEQGGKAVDLGVKQSDEAGQSITMLSNNVTEAAQAATQIAASSQQQLVGMDQVSSAIQNVKQASTQNMASAKQLEGAAHNLKELGQTLQQIMEHYKVAA